MLTTRDSSIIRLPEPASHPLPCRPSSPHLLPPSTIPRLLPHPNGISYDPYDPHLSDEATAQSAVRNLKDVAVNGRNLRVESSTDEPGPRRGRGGVELPSGNGGVGGGREPPPQGRFRDDSPPPRLPPRDEPPPPGRVDLHLLPTGQEVSGKATDAISKTLAAIPPGQMQDVMAGMKVGSRASVVS